MPTAAKPTVEGSGTSEFTAAVKVDCRAGLTEELNTKSPAVVA